MNIFGEFVFFSVHSDLEEIGHWNESERRTDNQANEIGINRFPLAHFFPKFWKQKRFNSQKNTSGCNYSFFQQPLCAVFFPLKIVHNLSLAFLWRNDFKKWRKEKSFLSFSISSSNKSKEGRVTFQTEAINLLFWNLFFSFFFFESLPFQIYQFRSFKALLLMFKKSDL